MAKLSIAIPSRDERFLTPTIDDIFRNARGEIEVVAVLDSDRWPGDWKEVTARHGDRLHTIHNGSPIGMRGSINRGIASAISRGATYIAKSDGHCAFSEGFDEVLKAEMDDDWIVVPRRLRLDPENWTIAEPDKQPHDYHYLSFPDDPNDFGGPGLNGKPWLERQRERVDILLDEEMSSQGSFWACKADYFQRLELMDEASYGPFWNEFQEIGLKCWLSGGKVMVNKRCHYLHLHKGKKYGRGYRLPESALVQGRNHTMKWIWNEAWAKQTKPFSWLISHFWPVPSWPENWEEVLYAERKPRAVTIDGSQVFIGVELPEVSRDSEAQGLQIIAASYGIGAGLGPDSDLDVTERVQSLVKDNSLDIIVNNSTLCPGQNPHRGKKKTLTVSYQYDGGRTQHVTRDEKDWLIIGQVQREISASPKTVPDISASSNIVPGISASPDKIVNGVNLLAAQESEKYNLPQRLMERASNAAVAVVSKLASSESKRALNATAELNDLKEHAQKVASWIQFDKSPLEKAPMSAPALNDYLIRKFSISPQRLRGPMPIELRDFHRNDLAELFAGIGFKRGAEIGVAEGKYSEVLLKANPECELLLVDPWHAYSDNPQNKTKEKHEFAYSETIRKVQGYAGVDMRMGYSMDVVREGIESDSLDFVYIDGNHSFDFVMQDLIEWSKRVRSGGIVSGDDYYALDQKRWIGGGVVEAVQAYTNAHRIPIWWIFSGHKSTDFFWVKP